MILMHTASTTSNWSTAYLSMHAGTFRALEFSLPSNFDTLDERQRLFADYNRIEDITSEQRIGASFITSGEMRRWIADLADKAIQYLDSLEDGETSNV